MTKALILVTIAAAIGTIGSAPASDSVAGRTTNNAEFLTKNYPAESLKREEQGRVGFQLTFEANGTLVGCAITQSSGFANLDNGTCEMLARSAKIEPARDAEGRRVSSIRSGYVDWKLPAAGVRLAQAQAQTSSVVPTAADPLVCKRSPVSGSIIKKVKRCMTRSEWKIQDRLVQDEIYRAQTSNTCSDHGC